MTAPSSHLPESNPRERVVDRSVVAATPTMDTAIEAEIVTGGRRPATPSTYTEPARSSGALVTSRGSFSSFLAPLRKETFREVVSDVESKLRVVNQTLSMLDMQGFDMILEEMLSSITFKTGELLNADRTTIFLLDEEKNEL